MTLAQAVAFLGQGAGGFFQVDLDDFNGSGASNDTKTELINWGLEVVGPKLNLYTATCTLDLAEGDAYGVFDIEDDDQVCSHRMIGPKVVTVDGRQLLGPDGNPGLWEFGAFQRLFPNWREDAATGDSSGPTYAVWIGESQLLLYPNVDATSELLEAFIEGQYTPGKLDYTDDSASEFADLGIPRRAEYPVLYCAAAKASGIVASHEEAWNRLLHFNAEWAKDIEDVAWKNLCAQLGQTRWRGMDQVLGI